MIRFLIDSWGLFSSQVGLQRTPWFSTTTWIMASTSPNQTLLPDVCIPASIEALTALNSLSYMGSHMSIKCRIEDPPSDMYPKVHFHHIPLKLGLPFDICIMKHLHGDHTHHTIHLEFSMVHQGQHVLHKPWHTE